MNLLKTETLPKYAKRIKFLEQNLVFPALDFEKVKPNEPAPTHITDLVRSYVVLAYGETEELVETISLGLLDHIISHLKWLQAEFNSDNKISKKDSKVLETKLMPLISDVKFQDILSNLLSNKAQANCNKTKDFLGKFLKSTENKRIEVLANNGLNKKDLDKLFDRLGFDTENNHLDLRNDLNLLTFKRSRFAHTGLRNAKSEIQEKMPDAIPITYLPTATVETQKLQQIVKQLDNLVDQLILIPAVL